MIDEEEYDLRCAASDIVWEKCEKSSLFDEKAEAQVPRFHPHEIEHGIFLGSGGFCTVTELMDVVLLSPSSETTTPGRNFLPPRTTTTSSRTSLIIATNNKNNNAMISTTSAASSSTADGGSSTSETIHIDNNAASHITTTTKGRRDRNNNKKNKNEKESLVNRKSGHLPAPVDNNITTTSGTTNNNTTTTTTTTTTTDTSTSSSSYSSSPFGVRSTSSHHQHSIIVQDRSFIAQYHQRDGHARYAIKMLSKSTLAGRRNSNDKSPDHKKFIAGVVDLALEVKYLSVIHHPHIIKMRGIAKTHPCSDSFFIILDRLYDTLSDRMKEWKKLQKRMSGLGTIRDLKGTKKEQALGERLVVAYNICSALQFLHQNNIIYRDLKPDNIGFDVRDDVKIFDFGLAAEMHPSLRIEGTNTYNLTAESGSPRYMAPEVALGQPYNQLADVYSFSILLWEMCTMKTPFSGYDFETLNKKVFKGSHRPELNSKWNKPLRDVMEKCWSRRISNRLECDEIMTILSEEIMTVYGGDGNILDCMNASSKTEASVVRRAIR